MEYRKIANTELEPSVICLGTGGFGTALPRERAWAILDSFAEAGGNFADSAHVYASWLPDGAGASERTLGAWVRQRGVRDRFIIGTKGAHPDLKTMHISRMSPAEISQDLTESLDRLGMETIDLYWLHRDDPAVPVGEILGVLNEHMAAGRIRALGASNWSVQRLQEAEAYAEAHHLHTFCASQIGYSLAEAHPEGVSMAGTLYMAPQIWQFHAAAHLPVVAFTSQAMGFFSGKYGPDGSGTETAKGKSIEQFYFSRDNFARLAYAQTLAARHGCTANQINLAYLLNQPFPVYPIVGSQNEAQVRDSCAAAGIRLDAEEIGRLDRAGEQC